MAKKSKRIASRQAQLSGRGRRVRRHGPQGFASQTSPSSHPAPTSGGGVGTSPGQTAEAAEISAPARHHTELPNTPSAPTGMIRARHKVTAVSPAPYFKPEIVRIAVITAIILAILATLTIAL